MGRRAAAAARGGDQARVDLRDRRHRARHPRAAGRLRGAVRHLAPPRVPGRRLAPWSSRATRSGWRGRSTTIAADPTPLRQRQPGHGAPLHRQPARRRRRRSPGVFDTHPPIQKRIAILLEMAHVGPEALAERRRPGSRHGGPAAAETSSAGAVCAAAHAPHAARLTPTRAGAAAAVNCRGGAACARLTATRLARRQSTPSRRRR